MGLVKYRAIQILSAPGNTNKALVECITGSTFKWPVGKAACCFQREDPRVSNNARQNFSRANIDQTDKAAAWACPVLYSAMAP